MISAKSVVLSRNDNPTLTGRYCIYKHWEKKMLTPCKACISQILHFQRILYLMVPIRHLLSRVFTILLRRPKRPFSWGYFPKCYLENADILRFFISITESYMICIYDKHRYQAILSRLLAWQYLIHPPPHLWCTTFKLPLQLPKIC